jgi:hypothetical protein
MLHINNKKVLLLCHDVNKGDSYRGLPYSKLIDSIYDELLAAGLNCQQIALKGSKLIGELSWGKPLSIEAATIRKNLCDKITWKFFTILSIFLVSKQNVSSSLNTSTVRDWLYIFFKQNSKNIFVIGATPEMCIAADFLSITIIEVLHGIGYHKIVWGWNTKTARELPRYILCFDKVSYNSFLPLSNNGVTKVVEIPHPWYKRFINKLSDPVSFQEWLAPVDFNCGGRKIILITLTWGYDGDHGLSTEFSNVVPNGLIPEELIKVIQSTKDSHYYLIRRHPVQIRRQKYNYQLLFLENLVKEYPNCEYKVSSSATLLSILPKVAGHVTLSSMTSYDAAIMGIKTLFLCPTLQPNSKHCDLFDDLVSAGYAEKIISDENYIMKWVTTVEKSEPYELTKATNQDWNTLISELFR